MAGPPVRLRSGLWMAIVAVVLVLLVFCTCLAATCLAAAWSGWQLYWELDRSSRPSAQAGYVRLTIDSARRFGRTGLDVRVSVKNTLPWAEPDAEIYIGDAANFKLGDSAGRKIAFSNMAVDYPGDKDYIEAGQQMEVTLHFTGLGPREPTTLVYESVYTGDRPLRVTLQEDSPQP